MVWKLRIQHIWEQSKVRETVTVCDSAQHVTITGQTGALWHVIYECSDVMGHRLLLTGMAGHLLDSVFCVVLLPQHAEVHAFNVMYFTLFWTLFSILSHVCSQWPNCLCTECQNSINVQLQSRQETRKSFFAPKEVISVLFYSWYQTSVLIVPHSWGKYE